MSHTWSFAIGTVYFDPKPVTGLQLAALVQQVVRLSGRDFFVVHNVVDDDLMSFGQTSFRSTHRIRVVPTDGSAYFRTKANYWDARVRGTWWGTPMLDLPDDSQGDDARIHFTAMLSAAYTEALTKGFPRYIEPIGDVHFEWR